MVEVYKSRIPETGTSFPSKTPFLTDDLISRRVGTDKGEG